MRSTLLLTLLAMGILSWIFGRGGREALAAQSAPPSTQAAGDVVDYEPADVYLGLREHTLKLKPKEQDRPDQVLAVLMETGYDKAAVTLAVVDDGTTSLYISNGGGMLGAGQHAAVRAASAKFLAAVAAEENRLEATTQYPLPKHGRVRFYVVSGSGIRTAEASEQDLGHNRHALSAVFHSGHVVIAAMREADTRQ